jgi:hypothetical protein
VSPSYPARRSGERFAPALLQTMVGHYAPTAIAVNGIL